MPQTTRTIPQKFVKVSTELVNEVTDPLLKALDIFQRLHNDRQSSACHFHLGAVYSQVWPVEENSQEASNRLRQALNHYKEAHLYYSKFDIGPTLLLILLDMCSLYLGSYAMSELQLNALYLTKKSLMTNSDELNTSWTPSEASELVVSLLGGALQSLLECRFALTSAVIDSHRSQMGSLLLRICNSLCQVLVRILKAQSRDYLPPPISTSTSIVNDNEQKIENNDTALESIRKIYADILRYLVQWTDSKYNPVSTNSSDLVDSAPFNNDACDIKIAAGIVNGILDTLNRHPYISLAFKPHQDTLFI